jgi:hypothetical protein
MVGVDPLEDGCFVVGLPVCTPAFARAADVWVVDVSSVKDMALVNGPGNAA